MIDNLDEKKRFASLMTALSDYYRQEISKGVLMLYWEGLRQYDYEAIEKAAWAHTQNPDEAGRWMPKIADITKMIQGGTGDQAAIAWSKVDGAIRRIGTYRDVAFDDPIIHRVLADMGGWILLGTKDDDEWPFVAKEFQTRYKGFRMRGEVPEYPPVLIGMTNASNGKEGFKLEEPFLIGDQAKAQNTVKGGSSTPLIQMRPAGDAIEFQPKQIA